MCDTYTGPQCKEYSFHNNDSKNCEIILFQPKKRGSYLFNSQWKFTDFEMASATQVCFDIISSVKYIFLLA